MNYSLLNLIPFICALHFVAGAIGIGCTIRAMIKDDVSKGELIAWATFTLYSLFVFSVVFDAGKVIEILLK